MMGDEFDIEAIKQELVHAVAKELDAFSRDLGEIKDDVRGFKDSLNNEVKAVRNELANTNKEVGGLTNSDWWVRGIGIALLIFVVGGGVWSSSTLNGISERIGAFDEKGKTLSHELAEMKGVVDGLPGDIASKLDQNTADLVRVKNDLVEASASLKSASDTIAKVETVANSNESLITNLSKSVASVAETVKALQEKTKAIDDFENLPQEVSELADNVKVAASDAKSAATNAKEASAATAKNAQEIASIATRISRVPTRYSLISSLRQPYGYDEATGAFSFHAEFPVKEPVRVADVQLLRMTGPVLEPALTLRGQIDDSAAVEVLMIAPAGAEGQVREFFAKNGVVIVQVKLESVK